MNSPPNIDTGFGLENYENNSIESQSLSNTFNHETIIIPDLHGNFEAYKNILLKAELVDSEMNWKGLNTHVVFLGDIIFDRNKQGIQILLSIDSLKNQAKLYGGDLKVIAGNHEEVGIDAIANYNSDYQKYKELISYSAFSGVWEFENFITQGESSMLPKMKESEEGKKLLRVISDFSLIERVGNSILVHTDITSYMVNIILVHGVDKINREYKNAVKAILYPELNLEQNTIGKTFRGNFIYYKNDTLFNHSEGKLLNRGGIENVFYGHTNKNLEIENIGGVNTIPLDRQYGMLDKPLVGKETFAIIGKDGEIVITKDGSTLDSFNID